MAESPHYSELLHTLNVFEIEYPIVGGYAVRKYTEPRFTKDLDLWVSSSPRNSASLSTRSRSLGRPWEMTG